MLDDINNSPSLYYYVVVTNPDQKQQFHLIFHIKQQFETRNLKRNEFILFPSSQ